MAKAKNNTAEIVKKHTDKLNQYGEVSARLDGNLLYIDINLEVVKYYRNRSSKFAMYDPLNNYKKALKVLISKAMEDANIELSDELKARPIRFFSEQFNIPARGTSITKLVGVFKGDLKRTIAPDTDNFQKTIYDVLNGIAWDDDSQIFDTRSIKSYDFKESTRIIIEFVEEKKYEGRLSASELIEYKELIEKIKKFKAKEL